jgi:hypothetical protein
MPNSGAKRLISSFIFPSTLSKLFSCHLTVSGCKASFNPAMLWSVCVYAGLISGLWFAYSRGFFETVDTQSFDNTILQYQDLAYHLIDLAIPINNWREARLVALYMASWSAFQVINNRSVYLAAYFLSVGRVAQSV